MRHQPEVSADIAAITGSQCYLQDSNGNQQSSASVNPYVQQARTPVAAGASATIHIALYDARPLVQILDTLRQACVRKTLS